MMRKTKDTKMEIQITQEEFNALLRGEISFDPAAIQHDKEEKNRAQDLRDMKIAEQQKKDREWKQRTDAYFEEHWNDGSSKLPYSPIMLNGVLVPEDEMEVVRDGGPLIYHEPNVEETNYSKSDETSAYIQAGAFFGSLFVLLIAFLIFAFTHPF